MNFIKVFIESERFQGKPDLYQVFSDPALSYVNLDMVESISRNGTKISLHFSSHLICLTPESSLAVMEFIKESQNSNK
jgi:hypothetical protein